MIVAQAMTRTPITAEPRDPLDAAVRKLRLHGFHVLPVTEGGRLVGILRDGAASRASRDAKRLNVAAAMDRQPSRVSAHTPLDEAAELLLDHRTGALPVIDDGKVVGVLTLTDVVRASLASLRAAKRTVETIAVRPLGGRLALAEVSTVVGEHGGEVMATAADARTGFYRLRVLTGDLDRVVRALTEREHDVIALGPSGACQETEYIQSRVEEAI